MPDFDEMDNRLLENIGVIESNINIAERSASLNELKETVNQLRDISENRNNRVSYEDQLKIDTAKDAVEKVTANQTSGQKNKPRSTSAQILYLVHHNELL